MARSFFLNSLLEEAHTLDLNDSRSQACEIRAFQIVKRHKDFVENYRL